MRRAQYFKSFYHTLFLPIIFTAAVAYAVVSCSGGGGTSSVDSGGLPPVLTGFSMEPTSAAAGQTITFSGSFSFTDPDGDLNGGSLNYTYEGTTYPIILPPELAGVTSATISFTLVAIISSNTGIIDIPFWLFDSAGHPSNTISGSFTQLWTREFGTMLEDVGYGTAIDTSNNVIVTGTTYGDLDGETNLGVSDVFVTSYAADTSRNWTRLIGSNNTDNGLGVAVDSNNNIYVTGDTIGSFFDGQVVDGPSAGFLSKYGTAGNRLWTRIINNSTGTQAYAVATDSSNNIYVTGRSVGNLDGETNAGTGTYDAFLVKYDASGNRQWTRLLGTTMSETAYGVATDSSGNIYLTGSTEGALGTDPSPGDPVLNNDAFVAKYNESGILQWVTQLGTSCAEWGKGIKVFASSDIYISGKIYQCEFAGNSASGGYDAFIAHLDNTGNSQWIKQFGTAGHDSANGVTTDSAGNAYVTGYLDSTSFNDDNEGNFIFLARYDAAGNQSWLVQDNAGYNWGNQGLSIATDSADRIFITGAVQGQMDGHTNSNYGEDEVFILKYDASGVRR